MYCWPREVAMMVELPLRDALTSVSGARTTNSSPSILIFMVNSNSRDLRATAELPCALTNLDATGGRRVARANKFGGFGRDPKAANYTASNQVTLATDSRISPFFLLLVSPLLCVTARGVRVRGKLLNKLCNIYLADLRWHR